MGAPAQRRPQVPGAARRTRLLAVLDLLRTREDISPGLLASRLGVSEATVRRDLAELASQQLVLRSYGRARANQASPEVPVALRSAFHEERKRRIAQTAATLVPAGCRTLALNGGSTTAEVAGALGGREGLTVVTNSMTAAQRASAYPQVSVVLVGGSLRPSSSELVGPMAERALARLTFEVALIGVDGFSAVAGATTHDAVEARTNREMVVHADRIVIVADGSKVGRVTSARIAGTAEVDALVTDDSAAPGELARLRALGVRVHVVRGG
ncbi:DeoR family transcriptional regulator [Motilibacter rhizosphaerae]|uniref:DeoR family transcriptional regulator n=1 Tax=Motilibacter rhizosphaerae TaxID=598652 RepID=A0A4Q7NWE1_9ACTN|nr:DeoR/GlpR family DNA-binding transcription regulator [Motilibacter rhizosphaerae]RZS91623.1 DeoR family transcriptional regulator [Motilibacter rhizosphaerae]